MKKTTGLRVNVDFTKKNYKILHIGLCANGYPLNGFQKALINRAYEYKELNCGEMHFNEKAISLANSMKPDIIFIQIQNSGIISIDTVIKLKQTGAYVVNWTGDVREDVPKWMIDIAPHLDNTLFSNMTDVYKMREMGFKSDYLEIGVDENIFTGVGHSNKIEPIVFFGNNYGSGYFPMSQYRIDMVSHLKRTFKNNFGVYGNGYAEASGNFCSSQHEESAAYRGTKMAINVSHFEYERYSSDRMLRILGSGTLCLAKWYPSIEKDFIDGKHIRTWKTLEELTELCNYYLDENNEAQRAKIAKSGMRLCHKKFTFNSMVDNLIEIYKLKK